MKIRLSPRIEPAFVRAGWQVGRSVSVPLSEFCDAGIFPAAASLLEEFHGLHVIPETRAGLECGTSDVHFDPRLSEDQDDMARRWMPIIKSRLFPMGEAGRGYLMLFVDEGGRVFETDAPSGGFCLVGESFSEAMETLLLGRRLRPLLLPGAEGILHYGHWIPANDARIYRPA